MSNNLPELFSELDEQKRILDGQIETARREVATTKDEIAARERDQVRLRAEISALTTEILQAPAGPPQRRVGLEATKTMREQTNSQIETVLAQLRLRLSNLLSERREEAAQQKIESHYGIVLIRTQALLTSIHDPVIRYLFVLHAQTFLARRNIGPTVFDSITEQAKAQELLNDLSRIRERATEADRTEAARFEALNNFHKEIMASSSSYSELQHNTAVRRSELERTAQELEKQISELSQPASDTEVRNRQLRVIGGFVIAGLALSFAVVLILAGDEAAVFSVLLFIIAAIAAFFGWRNTDRSRASQLTSKRKALQDVRDGIQGTKETSSRAASDAQQRVQEYDQRLRALGAEPSKSPGAAENPFANCMTAAGVLLETWLAKHPDIKVVLGSGRV
jgi:chromosome segregation ATPase